jgi:hypothetical protein
MMIEISPDVVAALGHVRRCDPIIAGRCAMCDELQGFYAQAKALVEPVQVAPGSQLPLETRAPGAPRSRLRKAN